MVTVLIKPQRGEAQPTPYLGQPTAVTCFFSKIVEVDLYSGSTCALENFIHGWEEFIFATGFFIYHRPTQPDKTVMSILVREEQNPQSQEGKSHSMSKLRIKDSFIMVQGVNDCHASLTLYNIQTSNNKFSNTHTIAIIN